MKRSKSGAQKRKEAATARDAVAKLPKMTDFFKITEQSRPGTSIERDEENYSVQEKEDYDDQHQSDCEFPENVSCDLPANTQPSISKITESQFIPIPDDPCKWPESISDAQRCDIVKRGPSPVALQLRPPPKVSARAPAHRSYHFRGVKLKSCIKKIHHNLYISKQANVRIKHADTEGASHKKFGTDARVQ